MLRLVNGVGNRVDGTMVRHVTDTWKQMQLAPRQLAMQPERMRYGVDDTVGGAGENRGWYVQRAIAVAQARSTRNHEQRIFGIRPELGRPHHHLAR